MLPQLVLAIVVALGAWTQDMPVTRLAGGRGQTPSGGQPPAAPVQAPPRQLPPLPVTQLDQRDITLDSPRRLTLTFAEPRPIEEVLQLLVMGTPFSLAIDPDVKGSFRGELKQLTLREALTTLLTPLGLDFQVQGTVIRITKNQAETRLFDLNLLTVQRAMHRTAGAPDAAISSSAGSDDVFAGVTEGVKALLSETGRVHVDARAGLAQVTDFPERLERVALYVETLQQRSGRQVRLQAQVFEVTLTDAAAIDWRAVRARLGLPRDASAAGLAVDPIALRSALAADGEIRDLWAPDVTTINNEPALVRIATPGGTSLTMTVVPQISADGIVQLSVSHAWEEHDGDRREGMFKSTPLTRITEADTVMRVMDGNTVLIAGFLRPQQVAAAGERTIFGSTPKKAGHAELVVLLRPTVVTLGTQQAVGSRQ
jgi:MSHA biogenesis protein MshL